MTTATVTIKYDDGCTHTYTVSVDRWDLDFDDFYQDILMPLARAAGYSERAIEEYLGDD